MVIDAIPFGNIAPPLQFALNYWNRMSKFTVERADLLTCQNIDDATRAIMKMVGMPFKEFKKMNYQTFIQ